MEIKNEKSRLTARFTLCFLANKNALPVTDTDNGASANTPETLSVARMTKLYSCFVS